MQFSVNEKLTCETDIMLWSLVTSELAQLDIYGCRNKVFMILLEKSTSKVFSVDSFFKKNNRNLNVSRNNILGVPREIMFSEYNENDFLTSTKILCFNFIFYVLYFKSNRKYWSNIYWILEYWYIKIHSPRPSRPSKTTRTFKSYL